MICARCGRSLIRCICDGWDERIASLEASPFLAIDFAALRAGRFLARFEIDRDREAAQKEEAP